MLYQSSNAPPTEDLQHLYHAQRRQLPANQHTCRRASHIGCGAGLQGGRPHTGSCAQRPRTHKLSATRSVDGRRVWRWAAGRAASIAASRVARCVLVGAVQCVSFQSLCTEFVCVPSFYPLRARLSTARVPLDTPQSSAKLINLCTRTLSRTRARQLPTCPSAFLAIRSCAHSRTHTHTHTRTHTHTHAAVRTAAQQAWRPAARTATTRTAWPPACMGT